MKTIIFDWKRTLYDPDNKSLISGAVELLTFLKNKNIPLVLIGKGTQEMHDEVERLGIKDYFSSILFREGDKEPRSFLPFMHKGLPKETVFVGDRILSELAIGNSLGATTIWVKQGKFAKDPPETKQQQSSYTVDSLIQLRNFFKTHYFDV